MVLVNDIVTRLYLNGDWRDISAHVRAEDGISYRRGRQGQDDTTPPQSCSLVLDNGAGKGNGDYTERNPLGQWYGYLGRFTPAEVSLRIGKDPCTTTASNGWGSTEAHAKGAYPAYAWSTFGGAASTYAKAAGKATHVISAANSSRMSYLAAFSQRDFGAVLTLTPSVSNVTGGPLAVDVVVRGQSTSSFYGIRIVVGVDEVIHTDFVDAAGVSLIGGAEPVDGLVWASGAQLKIRIAVEGRALRCKIWGALSFEPFAWTTSWVDEGDTASTAALCDTAGFFGIRSTVGAGNTNVPVTFTYDDIEIYSFIAAGEVSEWPQSQDSTAQDQTVQITINGPKGRLATAKTVARSAIRNQLLVNFLGGYVPIPDAYFPLEDGGQAVTETIKDVAGGNSRLRFEVQPAPANTTVGTVEWGADTTLPGLSQAPTVKGGGALFATIEPPTVATNWGFTFAAKINYTDGFLMSASSSPRPGVDPMYWRIRVSPEATVIEVDLLRTGAVVIPMMTFDLGSKELTEGWHSIELDASQVGSDSAYFLYVDGELADSYTDTGGTLQGVAYINLGTVDNATGGISYGHLAVWGDLILSVNPSGYHQAALGNPGEWPTYRAKRLAEEYGYQLDWIGFGGITGYGPDTGLPGTGKPMGAQRVTNLLDLLNDCEQVDGGILYEQRGSGAFQFRTLASMSGRTSWVTLNVATSKHLSGLQPVPDGRDLCNRFTARREDGGEFIYSLDSGPMSTLPPPEGGVGVVDRSGSFNVVDESALPDIARYRVARGTIDQERYPQVVLELHRNAVLNTAGMIAKLNDLDIGDQVTLSGLSSFRIYDDRDVIVMGITGQLDLLRHTKTLTTMPAELTRVLKLSASVAASTEASRLGSGYTAIAEDLTTTETDVTIAVEVGKAFWVNSVSHSNRFPFDVICGGEVMRVTAGTAPVGQNQTWTVTRSINSVQKTHSTGSKIEILRKNYLGM